MLLNLNVGVLGHVDAGKTSLTKILSEIGSTAAFDKNPQSKQRGITLDLGFSAFTCAVPSHLETDCDKLQFTLVDCPGHASLIKTIIGGAQIIDFMLLVLDVTKGFQTQTAECLVIGEITCKRMIVVLNKIDLLELTKKEDHIKKLSKKINATLLDTVFRDSPIVSVSSLPNDQNVYEGMINLVETMKSFATIPIRDLHSPFLCSIDHCFGISGQGTVLTGTILQGVICISDMIELPILKTQKKIKSIQIFKKPIKNAKAGDRIGLCISQLDPKLFERGIICKPGYIKEASCAIAEVQKIKYFKNDVITKSKYHITIGHNTIMATVTFFGTTSKEIFNYNQEYAYQETLYDFSQKEEKENFPVKQFALLEFSNPVLAQINAKLISSKLDTDINTNLCRLAFWGNIIDTINIKDNKNTLSKLKIYKTKSKIGTVERATNQYEIVAKNLFNKETNIQVFIGFKITLSTGEIGQIDSSFGQSGKVKIRIPQGLNEKTYEILSEKRNKNINIKSDPVEVHLNFKKYVFDPTRKIIQ